MHRANPDTLGLNDPEFQAVVRVAADSIVPPEKLLRLYKAALQALPLNGVWYECGVYKGGSAMLLAETIRRSGKIVELHVFDTFSGMPFSGEHDRHAEGTFGDVSYEAVVNKFAGYQDVYFHAGVIPATFTSRRSDRIAFAYLDVDQEQSARDCLEFVWPRVVVGGIVVIDDYDWPWCPGIKPVVDSFFRERGVTFHVHPNCQVEVPKES